MRLRDPPRYTQLPDDSQRQRLQLLIEIYHPGYTPPAPLILLRAYDDGALLYSMVYVICCIILGNQWADDEGYDASNGTGPFLSASSDAKAARFTPEDRIVPAGRYYLHYPGYKKKKPYPIVPHFNHWKFPDTLPISWRALRPNVPAPVPSTSGTNVSRPRTPSAYDSDRTPCPLTGQVTTLESSHILPQTTKTFIKNNDMRRFLSSDKSKATHLNPSNKIYFREDVHTLWDANALVFVPKPDSSNENRSRLVCHVLNPPGKSVDSDLEIHTLYHNIPILQIRNPLEFLFARFAWSLFTSSVIVLFADDDGKTKYSVLLRDGKKDKLSEAMRPVASLPRLLSKATGINTKAVAGEKRGLDEADDIYGGSDDDSSTPDIDELGINDVNADDRDMGNLVYSVRMGQMERDDGGAESGDCSLSSHSSHDPFSDLSDDSEPPRKKSRSSSLSEDDAEEHRLSRLQSRSKESEPSPAGDPSPANLGPGIQNKAPSKWSVWSKSKSKVPHGSISDREKGGFRSLRRILRRRPNSRSLRK
ncbi:hypothetical protein F5Y13DRAFT_176313 [Hypoxylon sp. FL1857]|nr:hypothetical protein F5Y13DRAFT_176313 [Hypoxylon sp. FL1857]